MAYGARDLLGELGVIVVVPPPLPVPAGVHGEMEGQQLVLRVGQRDNSWTGGGERRDYREVSLVVAAQRTTSHAIPSPPPTPRSPFSPSTGSGRA